MVPAILRSFKLPKDFNLALDPEDDQNQLAHLDPSMHDFKAIPQAVIEPLTRLLKFNYSCMTQLLRSAVHSSVLSNTRSIVRTFANALLQPDGSLVIVAVLPLRFALCCTAESSSSSLAWWFILAVGPNAVEAFLCGCLVKQTFIGHCARCSLRALETAA